MSRKAKKGYFVSGKFVTEGSELDLELKRELKGSDTPSRTDRKRESDEQQKLGEDLLTLRAELMGRLALPDKLADAIADAKRITNFEGKRRQLQFVGKLMRKLDADQLAAVRAALGEQHNGSASETLALHQVESWRERLIDDDGALQDWVNQYPKSDSQQMRALIRQARKDAVPAKPGEAPRHGKAYRELFQLVRSQLSGLSENQQSDDHAYSSRPDV
ncbi:MAG: ribosome biogenesis factor YjgA [Betaproteobacteria bacterium]